MSRANCSQLWMVEASRDGQLSAAEALRLRDHLREGCPVCRREARFLGWLTDTLPGERGADDEVALRRLRRAIVNEAHERLLRSPTRKRRHTVIAVAAALCLSIAAAYRFGRTPQIAVTPLTAERTVDQHREGDREAVVLGEGAYELTVERNWFDRSVIVHVPDGEIEDIGTVFSVRVEGDHTTQVHVTRGAVVLHLRDVPELRLSAGSVWSAPAASEFVAPVVALEPAPAELLRSESAKTEKNHPSEPRPAHEAHRRAPPRARHAIRAHEPRDASTAVDAENVSEDATYLRVLDLLHQRRMEDARRLGESYLERFPNGFRRPEIERLVRRIDLQ